MIFDNEYDNALWFIVRADTKNRKEIIDFIKEIPRKLLDNIRKGIEINRWDRLDKDYPGDKDILDITEDMDGLVTLHNWDAFDMDNQIGIPSEFFYCESENDSNVVYYFQIDRYNALRVRKEFSNGNTSEGLSEISLFPIKSKVSPFWYNHKSLGTIKKNIKKQNIIDSIQSIDSEEHDYYFCNTGDGFIVNEEIRKGNETSNFDGVVVHRKAPKVLTIKNLY